MMTHEEQHNDKTARIAGFIEVEIKVKGKIDLIPGGLVNQNLLMDWN